MIYPKKISAKKKGIITKSLLLFSLVIGIILIIINRITTPDTPWAALANSGIIYVWITVIYSINKNINIAAHVMIQTIAISLLTAYIDYRLGFIGWSLSIAIPILIIIANTSMLVLTIVSSKRYIRYAIYQLIIVIFSMLPVVFIYKNIVHDTTLSYIALGISIINFILSIILCTKDVKDEIVRKFHI